MIPANQNSNSPKEDTENRLVAVIKIMRTKAVSHSGISTQYWTIFAPVIMLSPFDAFREAVARANDSQFGLQAGVFTGSLENALYAFDHLEVGGVVINDVPTYRTDPMPYGGVKDSGMGREGPRFAIEEMTEMRLMVINRL